MHNLFTKYRKEQDYHTEKYAPLIQHKYVHVITIVKWICHTYSIRLPLAICESMDLMRYNSIRNSFSPPVWLISHFNGVTISCTTHTHTHSG